MKILRLKPGKERSALRRHPWIYDSAIAKGSADLGETVRVESDTGQFLGWAAYSPSSRIKARIWSFEPEQRIDADYFRQTLQSAIAARQRFDIQSDGMRLVHGEVDGLPGLIVDRYGATLVAQFLSSGTERWKNTLADLLLELTGTTRLYERSDSGVRTLEGLEPVSGWLRLGPNDDGHTEVRLREHDWQLTLDVAQGHKTGFYLDQRDSRHKFAQYARRLGFMRVLNCYCYTGGFTIAALQGMRAGGSLDRGGKVTSIDSSGPAIERARDHAVLNGFDPHHAEFLDADVNQSLRRFHQEGRTFDAIVLDPPKFAPTAAHADRAARAYKDINRLAFKILEPGGVLFTYSCSGGIGVELFHKIVASAGTDAGVDGYISERMQGAPDHPMTIQFPEGEYLKGLVVVKK
ncbi:MAG: class I SAM-dependent methyltransferase [Alphaproteobacteria bacterium]|nr:class I SAM-dependent methyltransferase [Alphaproteobacteria bacterium]MDI9329912.1 class I SAM-dependent methyltransferase [Alphaproteobacteria bacterium]